MAWLAAKAAAPQPVAILRKHLGLTHPQHPFAVAANVIVLEDIGTIQKICKLAEQEGYNAWAHGRSGFSISCWSIPFAFPPALTDIDVELQCCQCLLALNAPGADEAIASRTLMPEGYKEGCACWIHRSRRFSKG